MCVCARRGPADTKRCNCFSVTLPSAPFLGQIQGKEALQYHIGVLPLGERTRRLPLLLHAVALCSPAWRNAINECNKTFDSMRGAGAFGVLVYQLLQPRWRAQCTWPRCSSWQPVTAPSSLRCAKICQQACAPWMMVIAEDSFAHVSHVRSDVRRRQGPPLLSRCTWQWMVVDSGW
jgi:hypothetical protein